MFEKRLKELAKKHGGIGKLAEKLQISKSTLSSYTTGQRKPGMELFQKLAEIGEDIFWLLTGKHYVHNEYVDGIVKEIAELKIKQAQIEDEYSRELKESNKQIALLVKENERLKYLLRKEKEESAEKDATIEKLRVENITIRKNKTFDFARKPKVLKTIAIIFAIVLFFFYYFLAGASVGEDKFEFERVEKLQKQLR